MLDKKISDETKFLMVIIATILSVPLLFYLLNRFQGGSDGDAGKDGKQLTVVVSEADKNTASTKLSSKSVVTNLRDGLAGGNNSTAHMQLKKVPRDSPEYKELLKAIVEANLQGNKVKAVPQTAKTPLRYMDESSPRDRQADSIYLYALDMSGTPDLWFCIQSYDSHPVKLSGFKIKADGKTLSLTPSAIVTEKIKDHVAEYYDAPLNKQSYAAVKLLANARKATLVYVGTPKVRERTVTEDEKKGLTNILELYEGLGGSFAAFESN
jgi:hypothetical protein